MLSSFKIKFLLVADNYNFYGRRKLLAGCVNLMNSRNLFINEGLPKIDIHMKKAFDSLGLVRTTKKRQVKVFIPYANENAYFENSSIK